MSVAEVVLGPFAEESVRSIDNLKNHLTLSSNESIVIYLTFAGSVIPMRVLESDSIGSVKLRIQTCKGFVVHKQKLVFDGRELARDEANLKDYGVSSGNLLHLVVKLSDLILITVGTNGGKECEFWVDRHRNVGYVKRRIAKNRKGLDDLDEDQEDILYNGEKLEDERLIDDVCELFDAEIHLVVQESAKVCTKSIERDVELSIVSEDWTEWTDEDPSRELQVVPSSEPKDIKVLLEPVILNPTITFHSSIWHMIHSALDGLIRGRSPIQSSEGTGGTYLMQDASGENYIAVFKPIDEEPMAINNPQGLPLSSNGEGLKKGTRVGEGALREVAAYLLDHPKTGPRLSSSVGEVGFAGVPPTIMVQCLHRGFNHPEGFDYSNYENIKVGSLQMFMNNAGSCEDMGPKDFPVDEIHKISVLDIRTANADRHAGNILISREEGRLSLIPIDHGYCLPETFEDCTFDWLYWPQARQPYSEETIQYINSLDAEEDIELLKCYGWHLSTECARLLRISTMLLKKGAQIIGLTPFDIGSIMCRETLIKKSVIEKIVDEAEELILPGVSEAGFLEMVSKIMDIQLQKKS